MAGPGLPVNVDNTYPDDGTTPSVKLHQQHHDTIHAILNTFHWPHVPGSGDFPLHNGTSYLPTNFAAAVAGIVYDVMASGGTVGNTVTIFGANTARTHPQSGDPIPDGVSVLWVASTAPTNFVEGADIWLNRPDN